jgi:prophage regulatory protein
MTGTHDTPRSVAQAPEDLHAHNLPLKKPSERVQMDAGRSASLGSPDDISFLRLPDVKLMSGLSKSSIYALIRSNSFPAPVQLGPRTVAWVRSEVQQWAAKRVRHHRVLNTRGGTEKSA